MLNSNLLELLSKFTAGEIKEFSEFVSSAFFNKNENVTGLFIYLKKYYPEFQNIKLQKEIAFAKIFPGQKYNDGYMRTLMYRMQKLAEQYLSYNNYIKKEGSLKLNLLNEFNERKLEKAFMKTLSEQEKEFEESEYKGSDYFNYKVQIEEQKLDFYNWIRYKNKEYKDYSDESFFSGIDFEISAFLIKVLGKYLFILAKEQFNKLEYDFLFLDYIIDFLKTKGAHYKLNPVINLYLNEIMLLKSKDDNYYYILKEMLIKEKNTLSINERYSLHNVLNQYLAQRIFEGENKFKPERLVLYKIALKENIYKGSGDRYFDEIFFGGIVMVGVLQGEYDWTEKFIEQYKQELPPENKATVINFSLAKVSFAKKDFSMALKLLSRIRTIRTIQYKTAVRDLTLMTYYEMLMYNQAYFMADSYRHFLTKNISFYSDARFERISNFLKYFLKITKLRENNNLNEADEVVFELNKHHNVMERDWLLEKLKELKT